MNQPTLRRFIERGNQFANFLEIGFGISAKAFSQRAQPSADAAIVRRARK